jgi:gamma-glutamyl hercynylcysteine S-oxide synthase
MWRNVAGEARVVQYERPTINREPTGAMKATETTAIGTIARDLAEARARTLLLVAGVAEADLLKQHDPLMGPIMWDLGHIAHFEELWLLSNLEGEIRFGEMPGMFNPFEHPRAVRGELDLPDLNGTLRMLGETRARVLAALRHADFHTTNELLRNGYVYNMVLQHEYQHNETMLQTLKLKQGDAYRAPRATAFTPPVLQFQSGDMVMFPACEVQLGTMDRTAAYDNERPLHDVHVDAFWIDVAPVTSADYLRFMDAGGYTSRGYWSDAGWSWLQDARVDAPKYWVRAGDAWQIQQYDERVDANNSAPVCHVCWYEAEAYAKYVDKRLPTETEWEAAASWNPRTATKRCYPWGDDVPTSLHANVDQLAFAPAPVGTYDLNVSAAGCYGMIGDVWEWTASDLTQYPGYATFPYPEYSEIFFGSEYKVLRGGSWATRPGAIRGTFRNWDYPIRRQIFSGFRCARDV